MQQTKSQLVKPSLSAPGRHMTYQSRPHDVQNLYVSLKQWRILHAVVDCGGFAEAAKYLHLSQSAVSYTVAKLQEQLGISVLQIEGRKAQLTAAGRALLDRSRHVLKEAVELEMFARNLGQGWGSEVRLVVDHHFPNQLLMRALREFAEIGHDTHVRLSEVAMPRAEEVLRDLAVDLAIGARVPLGFLGEPLIEIEHVAVAHPDHPLLQLGRDVTTSDLARQVQIGIGNSLEPDREGGDGIHYMQRWNVNSLDTAVEAVCQRLGYAWLPAHRIGNLLDQGTLAALPMREGSTYKTMLYLIHGRPWPAFHAASRLAELLRYLAAGELVAHELPDANP
ncbi:LysR family transcriptional regulator [Noviherbaspirillum cavernae]|nr:LysR family transcriptional regulator [Noviherbaspirillum cavernae]